MYEKLTIEDNILDLIVEFRVFRGHIIINIL